MGLGVVILALGATFAVGTLIGWLVHWVMHQPWAGRVYRSHMTHHITLYPPKDLLSDRYRDAGADNGVFVFAPAITIVVAVLGLALYALGVTLWVLATIAVVSTGIGVAHDTLHTSFHLRTSWLTRFRWFRWLRLIHFVHHRRMNRNLGIFWFGWDRLLKAFRRP
jgi:hypothetical protein